MWRYRYISPPLTSVTSQWSSVPRAMHTTRIMALIMVQLRGCMRTLHGFGTEQNRNPAIWPEFHKMEPMGINVVGWAAYTSIPKHYERPYVTYIVCKRQQWSSGARLTKDYDVTIQRYRNSHAKIHDSKMHILRCMDSKFVWNFKGALWNFTQKFEPIRRKICILRGGKNLMTYDILDLWHLKS